jgi:hypothetical protein
MSCPHLDITTPGRRCKRRRPGVCAYLQPDGFQYSEHEEIPSHCRRAQVTW